jgi:hypothetical protein
MIYLHRLPNWKLLEMDTYRESEQVIHKLKMKLWLFSGIIGIIGILFLYKYEYISHNILDYSLVSYLFILILLFSDSTPLSRFIFKNLRKKYENKYQKMIKKEYLNKRNLIKQEKRKLEKKSKQKHGYIYMNQLDIIQKLELQFD